MATTKKVGWNATTRVATVLLTDTALPVGSVEAGRYTHEDPTDELSINQYSHVTYQHVRDILYRFAAAKVQDMQRVKIVDDTTVKATGLTVTPATIEATVGSFTQLVPTVAPATTTDPRVYYTTSNAMVATVDAKGKVYAEAVGEVTIFANTADGTEIQKAVKMKVFAGAVPVKVSTITLAPVTVSIAVAAAQQLTPTVLPANAANKAITWTSSDHTKATVSATGRVTGVAKGTSTITATAKDGSGKTGTKLVTVTA